MKKVFTFTRIVLSHSAIRVNSIFSLSQQSYQPALFRYQAIPALN